ncbi:hypothetical protein D3Y57_05465 [Sphingomonas paeninsulae]|uniref:Peptidase M28 domain-containing protein n=1 Tax=Sphingomonas paeninsulae TaxID=2319844 RepID=A0A494TJF0_SPHPE|nr:hypothetical protein [Sphingomonas paeninsulae]AYJ85528.1 hypothetical protein D3Y57_05465 [Sphingomonas paeninsulae]
MTYAATPLAPALQHLTRTMPASAQYKVTDMNTYRYNKKRKEHQLVSVPAVPRPKYVPPVFPMSAGDLEAMHNGTGELLSILSWMRPDKTQAEADFVRLYVADLQALADVYRVDGFGNIWVTIDPVTNEGARDVATSPSILFSCHTDTMHSVGGRQDVEFKADNQTLGLVQKKPGRCLGADDGAGLWLMREMIRARVPGSYVFHRAEEVGRLGSTWVERNDSKRLAGFDACIAFDRKGTDNLITHQMGQRGISDAFADSFLGSLKRASDGKVSLVHDDTGSYTDSYSYFDYIAECCNVSIGYRSEHGPNETLDVGYLWSLRCAMIRADFSGLKIERDPTVQDYGYGSGWDGFGWPKGAGGVYRGADAYADGDYDYDLPKSYGRGMGRISSWREDELARKDKASKQAIDAADDYFGAEDDRLTTLCREFPSVAATILQDVGITAMDFMESIGIGYPEDDVSEASN